MADAELNPKRKGLEKIITYTVSQDGTKYGDHEKLDDYLLEGYLVIDIITNVHSSSTHSPSAYNSSYLSVTVFLSKGSNAGIYKSQ
jgi:hypothetical protein